MKVIHKSTEGLQGTDSFLLAKKLEQDGELEKAAVVLEKLIKKEPLNENAYNRLMIIYRKNKDYKNELAAIKKGIDNFERSFKTASRVKVTPKIATLSKSLLKSLGLADKKGKVLYEREPLGKWKKRMLTVERLLKKKGKTKR